METIIGQVSQIKTTADQCIRLVIDVDKDSVPADIFTWLFDNVMLSQQAR